MCCRATRKGSFFVEGVGRLSNAHYAFDGVGGR